MAQLHVPSLGWWPSSEHTKPEAKIIILYTRARAKLLYTYLLTYLHTYLHTYSTVQSPSWEYSITNSTSAQHYQFY